MDSGRKFSDCPKNCFEVWTTLGLQPGRELGTVCMGCTSCSLSPCWYACTVSRIAGIRRQLFSPHNRHA